MSDFDDIPYELDERDDEEIPCPTCGGSGSINPLTAPKWLPHFCVGVETCPSCEGTGEAP